jgi:predicted MFS family arabinose efflux permease
MRNLALDASRVFAPFLAGLLLTVVDIDGVMLLDVATFIVAMITLLIVRIPRPNLSADGLAARGGWWQQLRFGFRYIIQRPGLRGLLLIFMAIQLFANLTYFSVLPAMILARTGGDELALGTVQASMGIGGIIGGLILSVWGGPRRKIHAIFGATAVSFFLGDMLFALGRNVPMWVMAGLSAAVFIPFISGANWAIWQAKVPPDVQGRVFSARAALEGIATALGYLLAGPLADQLFEPALQPGGAWIPVFSGLVGTGPGAGMAAMFLFTSIGGMLISLSGYVFPSLRNVETDLPDYDSVLKPGAAD